MFHTGNLSSLSPYFDPTILPSDLGGNLPPLDNSHNVAELRKIQQFLTEIKQFGYL